MYLPVIDYLQMREIIVIAHNIRSVHNVGSLLRTADGFGVTMTYLTGYTPYPTTNGDRRLPHIQSKITNQIHKTALGAEKTDKWHHKHDVIQLMTSLRKSGFVIAALEQSSNSIPLPSFEAPSKIALLLGSEVEGISSDLMELCNTTLEIPMYGIKESFNVVQAAAVAMYALREA